MIVKDILPSRKTRNQVFLIAAFSAFLGSDQASAASCSWDSWPCFGKTSTSSWYGSAKKKKYYRRRSTRSRRYVRRVRALKKVADANVPLPVRFIPLPFTTVAKVAAPKPAPIKLAALGSQPISIALPTDLATAPETSASKTAASDPAKVSIPLPVMRETIGIVRGRSFPNKRKYYSILRKVKPAGLPLRLAAAVVTVESGWRAGVVGTVGEVGLMQIRPATAQWFGSRKMKRQRRSVVKQALYNPETNLRIGTRYLYWCYKRAGKNVAATIGCYNRGPGRMWAWNKNHITKRYVGKVRRLMR